MTEGTDSDIILWLRLTTMLHDVIYDFVDYNVVKWRQQMTSVKWRQLVGLFWVTESRDVTRRSMLNDFVGLLFWKTFVVFTNVLTSLKWRQYWRHSNDVSMTSFSDVSTLNDFVQMTSLNDIWELLLNLNDVI